MGPGTPTFEICTEISHMLEILIANDLVYAAAVNMYVPSIIRWAALGAKAVLQNWPCSVRALDPYSQHAQRRRGFADDLRASCPLLYGDTGEVARSDTGSCNLLPDF